MKIAFKDQALHELYEYGKTTDRRYAKYNRDKRFVGKLIRQLNAVRIAKTYEDLMNYSPLHYERLKGNYAGLSSFRISNNYVERVICKEQEDCIELVILKLDDTHYGNKK